jgi:NAD(P)-dependent dehydrogenase (short-subunit alcohol dehydrogenase family)
MTRWTTKNIPDQTGKIFLITGANSGLGFESVRALAEKGAKVIMACRNLEKGLRSRQEIWETIPGADLDLCELDLASLDSISRFVTGIYANYSHIDVLMNNAGIMATPYATTADGFEQQFGTNHLGHFALTGKLLKLLMNIPGSRVVNVASLAARQGKIFFDDLKGECSYNPWDRYRQSKLANLLFTFELKKRLDAGQVNVQVIAAHPGVSFTNLHRAMDMSPVLISSYDFLLKGLLPDATRGALSLLYAAAAPDAKSGGYYGPGGWFEVAGFPSYAQIPSQAKDQDTAEKLWKISEKLTGVRYDFGI